MMRNGWLLCVLVCAPALTGCVDRRYVITSDPPGAVVMRNGRPLGATPVDDHFTYYGKYDFTLIKADYQTMTVQQDIPAPWYQYFPIDFFSEVLLPFRLTDRREFHYTMQPVPAVRSDELLSRGGQLRTRGQAIAPPPAGSSPIDGSVPVIEESAPVIFEEGPPGEGN